jgi:signal transduction histidine kinase
MSLAAALIDAPLPDRLRRCIRDLAALNALPSMCVGRTPGETLDVLIDALPSALSCDLVHLTLPGAPGQERGSFRGAPMESPQLAEIRAVTRIDADAQLFLSGDMLWCTEAEIPIAGERGRLVAGRGSPLDPETDRVLVRTAASVVSTILESANVLEIARRKDDFLAMLGHELRNPLAAIVTASDLLRHHPDVARERDVIERHTNHLVRLVDDLLDISRVTRGYVELRSEPVSLAAVLQRAVEIATPLVTRSRHELHVASAGDVALQGDPVRLVQIFGNLLTNAAKFTPPGGRIDVLVDPVPERVRVTVRDNGVGIAPDQIERIFEPFVQADRARDVLRGGLGLGLSIVRSLVRRHGGWITAQSEGRGLGAAFVVELPTTTRLETPAPVARRFPGQARGDVRVLVVDDNQDLAELLSEALQSEGFQTAIANDGSGAIASWRSFAPHVCVLDVGLPDLDGYQVAQVLRAEHGKAATLIAVTGYGQPNDRVRAVRAGFDCHLVKPVDVDQLVDLLDSLPSPRTGEG